MSGRIQAVIFDLDGVLVESEQVWDAARRRLTEASGVRWSEETAKLQWAARASNKSSSIRFFEELESGGAAQVVREGCEDLYRLTRCFVRAPLDC